MRVLRAVVIDRAGPNEFVAISEVAGVLDEKMTLELIGAGGRHLLRVCVVASEPVIIENALKHRVRLSLIQPVETVAVPVETAPVPTEAAAVRSMAPALVQRSAEPA